MQAISPVRTQPPGISWSWIGSSVMAAICLSFCIGIEIQNHRAGNYLPRASSDEGKWRLLSSATSGVDHERNVLRSRVEVLSINR